WPAGRVPRPSLAFPFQAPANRRWEPRGENAVFTAFSGALSIELSGRTFILLNPTVAGRLNPMVAGRLRPMVAGRPGSPARPSLHLPGMNKKLGRHHG